MSGRPIRVLALALEKFASGPWRILMPMAALREPDIEVVFPLREPTEFRGYDVVLMQRILGEKGATAAERARADGARVIIDFDDLIPVEDPNCPQYAELNPWSAYGSWTLRGMAHADALLTSTPELLAHYRTRHSHVRLALNALDLASDWYAEPLRRPEIPGVRTLMLWSGWTSHAAALRMIRPAVERLLRSRPDVGLVMATAPEVVSIFDGLPRVMHRPEVAFTEHLRAGSMADFVLAPLIDSSFNRCKSEIRLLEPAAWGVPAVASDIAPYRRFALADEPAGGGGGGAGGAAGRGRCRRVVRGDAPDGRRHRPAAAIGRGGAAQRRALLPPRRRQRGAGGAHPRGGGAMNSPLPRVVAVPDDDFACGNWRIIQPYAALGATRSTVRLYTGDDTMFGACDVVVLQRVARQVVLDRVIACKAAGKRIVIDYDDVFPITDPAIASYADFHPGSPAGRNIARALALADAVTVSTPQLAEHYGRMHPRVVVVPNAVDLAGPLYAPGRFNRVSPQLTMLWTGWDSHAANIAMIAPAVAAVMAERPAVVLAVCAPEAMGRLFAAPPGRLLHVRPVPYAPFMRVASVADIALAPLEPRAFNDAKSEIRLIEAGAWSVPAVASPAAPYVRFAGQAGGGGACLLASDIGEWRSQMLRLIDDAALRQTVGAAARQAVAGRYTLAAANEIRLELLATL